MKIFLCTCLIVALWPAEALLAQKKTVDSINRILIQRTTAHVADRYSVDLYIRLAYSYSYVNADSTIKISTRALALSKAIDYKKGYFVALRVLGIGYITKGEYVTAYNYIKQAIQLAQDAGDDEEVGDGLNDIINIYSSERDYKNMTFYIDQGLTLFKKTKNNEFLIKMLSDRAEMYSDQNHLNLALKDLKQILELAGKNSLSSFVEQQSNKHIIAYTSNDVANIYLKIGNFQKALPYYMAALNYYKKVDDDIGLIDTYSYLAKANFFLKRYDTAQYFGEKSYDLCKGTNMIRSLRDVTEILFPIYYAKKEYQKAFYFQGLFKKYSDGLFNEAKTKEMGRQEAKFEYEKQLISSQLVQTKKEAQNRQRSAQQLKIIFLTSSALLLSLGAMGFIYKSRQKNLATNKILLHKNEEINQQADSLQVLADELTELNSIKTKLFSIIAHDLRTPMVSFIQMLQLVESGVLSSEEFKETIPTLLKDVSYTSTLLENLLLWSNSQMNGFAPHFEELNLFACIESDVKLFDRQIRDKDIKINILAQDPFVICSDKDTIELVLRNLIANAVKFTPFGGNISISATATDGQYSVFIKDTGAGLSAEAQEKLFGDAIKTTLGTAGERGTGLGLKLCKEFIERIGGKIWVKSAVGKGSIFGFTIPAALATPCQENVNKLPLQL